MKEKKPDKKLFIVRKYIEAHTLLEAIKKEKTIPVTEIWIDEDWKKAQGSKTSAIGFHLPDEEYE